MTTTDTGRALVPAAVALDRPTGWEDVARAWLLGFSSPHTRRAYTGDLRMWADWLSGHDLDPLQADEVHVDAWARALEADGRAPASTRRALTTLASFYGYAARRVPGTTNPAEFVRRPARSDESSTDYLDRQELERVLTVAEGSSPRDYAMLCVLAYLGLRIGTALAVDVDDLGHERGHRTVFVTAKGGKQRKLPLVPKASAAVDAYLDGRTAGPLFITSSGQRLSAGNAYNTVRSLTRRAGIAKRISPHSFRHGFVTLALDAGASLRDVQDAAMHASADTTRRYDRARHQLDRHPGYLLAAS